MLFTVIMGVGLGLSGEKSIDALLWMIYTALAISIYEITIKRNPITMTDSPYIIYLQNLHAMGRIYRYPWFGYIIKFVFTAVPSGMLAYAIAKYFST